jgi:hypothetical protein
VLLASALVSACADHDNSASTAPAAEQPAPLNARIRTGEKFVRVGITNPATTSHALSVGATKQMAATLYYNLGGTIDSKPYATWYSVDPCVASVSTTFLTKGLVKGVRAGSTKIIVTAFGKSDTVNVTVSGAGNLDARCEERLWGFNFRDVSFTTKPAPFYPYPKMPKTGARIGKLVTLGWTDTLSVGQRRDVKSELWYTDGARLNAELYGARYLSTNGAVASVNSMTGAVVAVSKGRTTIIQKLGNSLADTIPVIVR